MKKQLQTIIEKTLKEKLNIQDKLKFKIELPKEKKFGDLSTNIAMILASKLKKNPREIAENIKNYLSDNKIFEKIEIAGPGFLNFFISKNAWLNELNLILNDNNYLKLNIGNKQKILIEYVSANPTGPLHIGHGRGAVLGDVLARLLSYTGFDVVREYYLNDAGNQMIILGKSIKLRLRELCGEKIEYPKDYYQGKYIIDIAKEILNKFGKNAINKDLDFFIEYGVNTILPGIKEDLKNFGVEFDSWFSEKSLFESGKVQEVIELLKKKNKLYEKDGAWWLKVEDDDDRVVIKSDGSLTYLASDIAYHKNKFERGFNHLINIWGADHHGYIPRIKSAIKWTGEDPDKLKILLVQMVNLLRGKVKIPLSTRKGEFVTLKEVVDEVGKDAARFIFMTRKYDAQLDFDLEVAKLQSNENPVYYVQYAHARICSIFRQNNLNIEDYKKYQNITSDDDIELIKKLIDFKNILEIATLNYEPHLITYYLLELASLFHSYYNKNKISDNNDRLCLANAVKKILKTGLDILGVNAPEKM